VVAASSSGWEIFVSPAVYLIENQDPILTKKKLSANDALDGSEWKSI